MKCNEKVLAEIFTIFNALDYCYVLVTRDIANTCVLIFFYALSLTLFRDGARKLQLESPLTTGYHDIISKVLEMLTGADSRGAGDHGPLQTLIFLCVKKLLT